MELRKARKEDQLSKRRNLNVEEEKLDLLADTPGFSAVDKIIIGMNTSIEILQLEATQACRKLLSREKNPPISAMIEYGIVPRCIELLSSKK